MAVVKKRAKGEARRKGKKNRKHGRYSRHPASMRYRSERRWERNKKRKLLRHLRRHPNDAQAAAHLGRT